VGAAACRRAAERTENPYSVARIRPVSRSSGRAAKLPEAVRTVTIVRLESSRRACCRQTEVLYQADLMAESGARDNVV